MSRGSCVACAFLLAAVANAPALAAQTLRDPNAVRVVAVTYADGRTTKTPVRERGWVSWTPAFPRIAGAETVREGLSLNALQLEHAIDGRELVVTVALLYGMPHQKRVPVAAVRLSDQTVARVDELREFGVQPITLALETIARPELPVPSVVLPSSHLEANVDVDAPGAPQYRIAITNHAQQGVMALAFQGFHGQQKGMSGKPHATGHTQLIAPGETYTITLTASPTTRPTSAADAWFTLDRIVFTSVTWSDGIVEGNDRPAVETQVVDDASARQLARALNLMRAAQAADAPDLLQLRATIAALSIDDAAGVRTAVASLKGVDQPTAVSLTRIGMQMVKDGVLNDFDEFLRDPRSSDPAARRTWLTAVVAKFDGWRTRIVTAPR